MSDVVGIVAVCLYIAGWIITVGDALIDEHTERQHAQTAKLDAVRAGSLARVQAAARRLRWSGLWPVLLVIALWRLRNETTPRHKSPRPHR